MILRSFFGVVWICGMGFFFEDLVFGKIIILLFILVFGILLDFVFDLGVLVGLILFVWIVVLGVWRSGCIGVLEFWWINCLVDVLGFWRWGCIVGVLGVWRRGGMIGILGVWSRGCMVGVLGFWGSWIFVEFCIMFMWGYKGMVFIVVFKCFFEIKVWL